MSFSFGDIVLVPFPFTDQSAAKRRPAVIVCAEAYAVRRRDVILMPVTSQLRPEEVFGEVWLHEWAHAGLLKPSAVKPVIATLTKELVLRRLGSLAHQDRDALLHALNLMLGVHPEALPWVSK